MRQGNYEEFRFFTGMRPSEEIALEVADCDLTQGKVLVSKARVMRHDKDRTNRIAIRLLRGSTAWRQSASTKRSSERSHPAERQPYAMLVLCPTSIIYPSGSRM
jgi:integrase